MSQFQTGDGSDEAVLFVTMQLIVPVWFRQNLIGAIVDMTSEANWLQGSDTAASVEFARDKAVEMLNSLAFSEENPLPINKPYISEIRLFAKTEPPIGWLRCDGQTLLKADYPDLYLAVLNYFGTDTMTQFKIPDLRGRFPLSSTDGSPHPLGELAGEADHVLTIAEMPAHDHDEHVQVNAGSTGTASAQATRATTGAQKITGTKGGGGAHNNMPPYVALLFAIYTGVEV